MNDACIIYISVSFIPKAIPSKLSSMKQTPKQNGLHFCVWKSYTYDEIISRVRATVPGKNPPDKIPPTKITPKK